MDYRRRRLGIRYRFRGSRPRNRFGTGCQHPRSGYGGLLQYGRPVFQGDSGGCGGQVRFGGQAHPQERPRSNRHDLRLRLCGAGFHRSQPEPAAAGNARGGGLQRSVAHHRLCSVYQPRHQGRHDTYADRRQGGRRVRLLAPVALQSGAGRKGRESLQTRLERARLEQVPGVLEQ